MTLKKIYENPKLDIASLGVADIIATSGPEDTTKPPMGEWDDEL